KISWSMKSDIFQETTKVSAVAGKGYIPAKSYYGFFGANNEINVLVNQTKEKVTFYRDYHIQIEFFLVEPGKSPEKTSFYSVEQANVVLNKNTDDIKNHPLFIPISIDPK